MQALMVSRRNHMFVIIKKGENVNVCIHDFDDAKEKSNKVASGRRIICCRRQYLDAAVPQKFVHYSHQARAEADIMYVIDNNPMCVVCLVWLS